MEAKIKIALNNGRGLELVCPEDMSVGDVHTLARQISECAMVFGTRVGLVEYEFGIKTSTLPQEFKR